jgi:hypothetical protein
MVVNDPSAPAIDRGYSAPAAKVCALLAEESLCKITTHDQQRITSRLPATQRPIGKPRCTQSVSSDTIFIQARR